MRIIMIAFRIVFASLLIAATIRIGDLHYDVLAWCDNSGWIRGGHGSGSTCGAAYNAAVQDLNQQAFIYCNLPEYCGGVCGIQQVEDEGCYWDGSQYQDSVTQEYGCVPCP